jgi:hypothetical protein
LTALTAYPLLAYPVVENSLPPAPWPGNGPPDYLRWKQDLVAWLFLLAVPLALTAFAVLRRSRRAALALGVLALAVLGAGATLGVVLGAQWADAVPGTPA